MSRALEFDLKFMITAQGPIFFIVIITMIVAVERSDAENKPAHVSSDKDMLKFGVSWDCEWGDAMWDGSAGLTDEDGS